jgi:hypothetical protein
MRKLLRVGDVAVAALPGGGFGACQVSGFGGESVVVHALDWFAPQPAGLDDLRGVGPAILRRHRFREEMAQTSVAPKHHPLPPDFTWIGNLPVPAGVPGEVNRISGWEWPFIAVVLDRDGADLRRMSVPPTGCPAAPIPSPSISAVARRSSPPPSALSIWRPVPSAARWTGPFWSTDWTVLEHLPRCTEISWSGPDRGLTAAVERHPLVGSLAASVSCGPRRAAIHHANLSVVTCGRVCAVGHHATWAGVSVW